MLAAIRILVPLSRRVVTKRVLPSCSRPYLLPSTRTASLPLPSLSLPLRCWFTTGDGDDDDDDEPVIIKEEDPLEDLIRQRRSSSFAGPARKVSPLDATVLDKDEDDDDDDEKPKRGRKDKRRKIYDMKDDHDDDLFAHHDDSSFLELLELQDYTNDDRDQEYNAEAEAAKFARQETRRAERKEEMNHKTGRGWTDPMDLEDMYAGNDSFDDLPDWTPATVSKISLERVQLLSDGIPTLSQLARLPLPLPPHPHPGHGHAKAYALHRTRTLANQVYDKVAALAAPRIAAIQALPTWQDKQDAVDELFERIEFTLKEQETILGKHPKFGQWVERALEKYLQSIKRENYQEDAAKSTTTTATTTTDEEESTETVEEGVVAGEDGKETQGKSAETIVGTEFPTNEQDEEAMPLFMDCFVADPDSEEENIPKILYPLGPLKRGANQGRMMEEWQLAAHKTTKRILLRQSTRSVAQFMEIHPSSRILVTGRQGTGKTATLLSLVAAARQSGHIVMFMPHCSMLAEHGYYIEPNEHRPGMYDLPVLSEQVCGELLASHKDDLASISVDMATTLPVFFSEDQMHKLGGVDSMTVADLLSIGAEKRALAPMCYSAAVDTLMKQDDKPFTMVLDEFNTFYGAGMYFHEHYDEDVRKSIPYNQINLFQPALDAMGLTASVKDPLPEPVLMKRGAVIAAMSYSKPVGDKINDGLVTSAKELAAMADSAMLVSDVPRLSSLEVDHVMANYEAIGFGKLRMDQGETVTNAQEVAYLRIISSNVPQQLMNACII